MKKIDYEISLIHTSGRLIESTTSINQMRMAVKALRHDDAHVVYRGEKMSMGKFLQETYSGW